jgi:hypothetical protein
MNHVARRVIDHEAILSLVDLKRLQLARVVVGHRPGPAFEERDNPSNLSR